MYSTSFKAGGGVEDAVLVKGPMQGAVFGALSYVWRLNGPNSEVWELRKLDCYSILTTMPNSYGRAL